MTKLIGSAGSLEALKKLVGQFFYSNEIEFKAKADGLYSVHNGAKLIEGCQVRAQKGRYRFEMVSE